MLGVSVFAFAFFQKSTSCARILGTILLLIQSKMDGHFLEVLCHIVALYKFSKNENSARKFLI